MTELICVVIQMKADSNCQSQIVVEANEIEDDELVKKIRHSSMIGQTAVNVLDHAGFTCEIDPRHPIFIRKHSDKPYTEPHHLIPLAMQDQFDVSLDVEENIISICSNCHNEIHYGKMLIG